MFTWRILMPQLYPQFPMLTDIAGPGVAKTRVLDLPTYTTIVEGSGPYEGRKWEVHTGRNPHLAAIIGNGYRREERLAQKAFDVENNYFNIGCPLIIAARKMLYIPHTEIYRGVTIMSLKRQCRSGNQLWAGTLPPYPTGAFGGSMGRVICSGLVKDDVT